MQQSFGRRPITAPAVLGALLIVVGIAAFALRESGVNLWEWIGPESWPFLIIVPGLVLLGASVLPAPPRGAGFAPAGAVVTTVGSLLLYQARTGHWESWAYAWALLPLAAGVALVLYGLYARDRTMVRNGAWMAGISTALFAAGAWFYEGIFAGEERTRNIGEWWPLGVVILGMVIVLRALLTAPSSQIPTDVLEAEPPPIDPPRPA
jgi:hypothetical protein